MNAVTFIRTQVAEARDLLGAAMSGVTDEQFNWMPPPTINPIKAAFAHTLAAEDIFVQGLIQGLPPVWETEGWCDRVGVPGLPGGGQGWEEFRTRHFDLAPLLAYADAVYVATDRYLAALTDEELDRPASFFGQPCTVGGLLAKLVAHTGGHAGEIAAAKGLQGTPGLPF